MRALILLLLALAPLPSLASPPQPPPHPLGAEIPVNVSALGNHSGPRVALFADGGFAVVWTNGGPPKSVLHARFFRADGRPASGEFRLGPSLPGSSAVTAAVADNKTFLVAWDYTPPGRPSQVMVGRFDRRGQPVGAAIAVTPPSPRSRFGGRLAVRPGGGFAIAWTAEEDHLTDIPDLGEVYAYDVHGRAYSAGGRPVGAEFQVNESTYDDQVVTGLAVEPDGTLVALYFSYFDPNTLVVRRLTAEGQPLDTERIVGSGAPQNVAALSMAKDGSFTIAWTAYDTGDNVLAQRFAPDGQPAGDVITLNRFGLGGQVVGDIATSPDGGFVVAWTDYKRRDGDGAGVFGRSFTAAGEPLIDHDFRINVTTAGDQFWPVLAGRNGRFVAAWNQGNDVTLQHLTVRARLLGCLQQASCQ